MKNWLEENRHILIGLRDITAVFSPGEYRIFGSLIPASLSGPYKRIGDIDMFVDEGVREKAIREFKLRGYQVSLVRGFGNIVGINPLRFLKKDIQVDMFFGEVEPQGGWRYFLKNGFSLYVPPAVWQPCKQFEFRGTKFSGITPSAAYYNTSVLEKKLVPFFKVRSKDLRILKKHSSPKEVKKIKAQKPGLYFKNFYIPCFTPLIALGNLLQILESKLIN